MYDPAKLQSQVQAKAADGGGADSACRHCRGSDHFLHRPQQYDTLLATTIKPTLSPPVLSFQATESLFRMGSIGPEVIQLQQRLKALGYYQGELDGQYGKGTQEAISRFQNQNSLEADGMGRADPVRPLR